MPPRRAPWFERPSASSIRTRSPGSAHARAKAPAEVDSWPFAASRRSRFVPLGSPTVWMRPTGLQVTTAKSLPKVCRGAVIAPSVWKQPARRGRRSRLAVTALVRSRPLGTSSAPCRTRASEPMRMYSTPLLVEGVKDRVGVELVSHPLEPAVHERGVEALLRGQPLRARPGARPAGRPGRTARAPSTGRSRRPEAPGARSRRPARPRRPPSGRSASAACRGDRPARAERGRPASARFG